MVDRTTVRVLSGRKVTIPVHFFEKMGIGKDKELLECILINDILMYRPIGKNTDTFSEDILEDLVKQGYSGDTLMIKYIEKYQEIKESIQELRKEANDIENGTQGSATIQDIFGF